MSNIIQVGMADIKIASEPDKLMTAGLGSCIGICIYDINKKIGSLAHIMLPSSVQAKRPNKAKYADTAIVQVIEELNKKGSKTPRLVAKIAGGAQMFKFSGDSNILKIGERNAAAVIENLDKHKIRLLAKDVGGNYGRTITFDIATGALKIRTLGHGERII